MQQCCCSSVDGVLGWGAKGPRFDTWSLIIFFTLISFKEEMRQLEKNKNNNSNNLSNSEAFLPFSDQRFVDEAKTCCAKSTCFFCQLINNVSQK